MKDKQNLYQGYKVNIKHRAFKPNGELYEVKENIWLCHWRVAKRNEDVHYVAVKPDYDM